MGAVTMETYTPKTFTFDIPIRAKAVQSTRFARGHSFVDAKTKKWKKAVGDCIKLHAPEVPSELPFEVVEAVYTFKLPQSLTKKARARIEEAWSRGEDVAYISTPDLDSNINKGLSDLLTDMGVWADDRRMWRVAKDAVIKKVYGKVDSIRITIRETPFVLLSNGKTALEHFYGHSGTA